MCTHSVPSSSNTCTPLIREPLVSSFGCDCFVSLNALLHHTHTHTRTHARTLARSLARWNMHNHEANSCPDLVCKWRCVAMMCNVNPPLVSTSTNLHHMRHVLHMLARRGKQGLLGTSFKPIKTASDAVRLQSISPPMPRARTGFSFCTACLCILLHWRYKDTIQPFQGNRASLEWNNWFQRKLSAAVWMCVYMHLQHLMYKVSGAEQPGTSWKGQMVCWQKWEQLHLPLGALLTNSRANQTPTNKAASLGWTHWEAATALRLQTAGCPQPTVMLLFYF